MISIVFLEWPHAKDPRNEVNNEKAIRPKLHNWFHLGNVRMYKPAKLWSCPHVCCTPRISKKRKFFSPIIVFESYEKIICCFSSLNSLLLLIVEFTQQEACELTQIQNNIGHSCNMCHYSFAFKHCRRMCPEYLFSSATWTTPSNVIRFFLTFQSRKVCTQKL